MAKLSKELAGATLGELVIPGELIKVRDLRAPQGRRGFLVEFTETEIVGICGLLRGLTDLAADKFFEQMVRDGYEGNQVTATILFFHAANAISKLEEYADAANEALRGPERSNDG